VLAVVRGECRELDLHRHEANWMMPLGSRRRRLWELDHKCLCPVIGTCFDLVDLRKWSARLLGLPKGATDYDVHVSAVHDRRGSGRLSAMLLQILNCFQLHTEQLSKLRLRQPGPFANHLRVRCLDLEDPRRLLLATHNAAGVV
jgi:hypothetical protein